jgi:phosphoribosyl-ATP pyrophosphohydrolase
MDHKDSSPKSPTSVKEAYLIGGHGEEDIHRWSPIPLPDNVYVVVKAKAGEVTMTEDNLNMKLCDLSNEVLQHPEKYPEKIYDAIGSFFLYGPGELCPGFGFSTVAAYLEGFPNVSPKLSGIMNIRSVKNEHYADKKLIRFFYQRNELEFIENMFVSDEYSLTEIRKKENGKWKKDTVATNVITECKENGIELRDEIVSKDELLDTIEAITDLPIYNTTMFDILYHFGEKGMLTQGAVFYHLACRYHEGISDKLYGNPNAFNNVATRQKIIINRVPSRKKDPALYRLIQNTISNAEKMKSYTRSIMTRKKPQSVKKVSVSNSTEAILHIKPNNTKQYITYLAIKIMSHIQLIVLRRKHFNMAELIVTLMNRGFTMRSVITLFKKIDELVSHYKRNESLFKRMHHALINQFCEVCVAMLYNKASIYHISLLMDVIVYDETYYKKDIEKKVLSYIEHHFLYRPRLH